jgi:hypothetical protein
MINIFNGRYSNRELSSEGFSHIGGVNAVI